MGFSAYIGAFELVISVIALTVSVVLYAEGAFDAVLLLYILFFFLAAFDGINNLRR